MEERTPAIQSGSSTICQRCGHRLRAGEMFCFSCGKLQVPNQEVLQTHRFSGTTDEVFSEARFDADDSLILTVPTTQETYVVRPQHYGEALLGRGPSNATLSVDLVIKSGVEQGVSRVHASIAYNSLLHTLGITDLQSANGTYINGERLQPGEVRFLKDGDELKLGKLPLQVSFRQPTRNA